MVKKVIMNAKELLTPRYEVIETYPNSKFKKGDILEKIPIAKTNWYNNNKSLVDAQITRQEIDKYPHLFRKLNWWEARKEEEMPKKLKSLASKDDKDFDIEKQEVFEIVKWDMKTFDGFVNIEKRKVCALTSFKPEYGYIPVD